MNPRTTYARDRAVLLPGWLDDEAVNALMGAVAASRWVDDTHTGSSFCFSVLSELPDSLLDPLRTPAAHRALERLTGVSGVVRFEGTVKRLGPEADQRFPWHRDHRAGQLLGISVDLSERPYEGGHFEQRLRWCDEPMVRIKPDRPGDAHVFDVRDPRLVHRVTPVTGDAPRVFLAGWFFGA